MKIKIKITDYIISIFKQKIFKLTQELEKKNIENQMLLDKLARLSKNSATSSKPPSSDIVKPKKLTNSNSQKRKKGGQRGHEKHEWIPLAKEDIHDVFEYQATTCPLCNHAIEISLVHPPKIIQQAEIINVPIHIEEHRAYAYWCENCQKLHYAEFPPEVIKAGLFKAKISAVVAYMKNVCHCSYSTIRKYFRDILRRKVSKGYLCKVINKVSQSLEFSYNEFLEKLPLSTEINIDETGHKESGERFWT